MVLSEYVLTHTQRGACRRGCCIDAGLAVQPTGHTVNMVFFEVAMKGEPNKEEFLHLVKYHQGIFGECDPLDGQEHSYIELGWWVGDQGLALQTMALGTLLKAWDLLSPYTVFGADCPKDLAGQIAGMGMVSIQAGEKKQQGAN